jgi:hypothetical protein
MKVLLAMLTKRYGNIVSIYKLNSSIIKTAFGLDEFKKEAKHFFDFWRTEKEIDFKPTNSNYEFELPEHGINCIAISDAKDHIERLVFPAVQATDKLTKEVRYAWDYLSIAGYHTNLDAYLNITPAENTIKKPIYYLNQLALANGFDKVKLVKEF